MFLVDSCEFYDCAKNVSTGTDSALRLTGNSKISARGCIFHDNVAASCLAAVSLGGSASLHECVFENNTIGLNATMLRRLLERYF